MAIFGLDFYGLSKYGGLVYIDYGVDPFLGQAINYQRIKLTWNEPSGQWNEFRILVSRAGFSINENDGTVILDIQAGHAADSSHTPRHTSYDYGYPGWYYFSIFILNNVSGDWERAATVSVLAPTNYDGQDYLWGLIPSYFRTIQDITAGFSDALYNVNPALYMSPGSAVDNEHLKGFIGVFGWGFDNLRSQIDTVLWDYDPSKAHVSRLGLLASELGFDLEQTVPAPTARNLVRNLGLLYRMRGTPQGIAELLGLATGWEVDVLLGPNRMLSEDQGNFVNPMTQPWSPYIRYTTGMAVTFDGFIYTANETAYGADEAPAIGGADNTWWNHTTAVVQNTTLARTDTNQIGSWMAFSATTGAAFTAVGDTFIGEGAVNPLDPGDFTANVLGFRNPEGGTDDFLIRTAPFLVGQTDFDPGTIQELTVPTPVAVLNYQQGVTYQQQDLVNFNGAVYMAIRETSRYPWSTDWKKMGYDRRMRLCLSFYTHGQFVGDATAKLVTPYVIAFDDTGSFLYDVQMNDSQVTNVYYDSMAQATAFNPSRVTDVGGATWEWMNSTWGQDWFPTGDGFVWPDLMSQAYAMFDSTISDCNVGITFENVGDREMGVAFRCSDNFSTDPTGGGNTGVPAGYIARTPLMNAWVATQLGLYKVVSETITLVSDYSGVVTFNDGDRLTVQASGTNISVYQNGNIIVTVSDSFNETATQCGIVALNAA